jgi:hypothetical protein
MNPATVALAIEAVKLLVQYAPDLAKDIGEILAKNNPSLEEIEALKTKYAPDYSSFNIQPPRASSASETSAHP